MRRVQGLLGWGDRLQQRSRWLGFPFAVMGKFRDDHGGALTTVIAYNAFFALFPLLLVVVTVLGFLLGRDSGFQQRLLGSAVADFPIIGDQVQDNIHGPRGSGVGLVIGLVAFAWGGGRWLPGRPLPAPHQPGVWVFAIVLGLLFWLYLGARLTLYAAEVNVVAARRLWPRSLLRPLPANTNPPASADDLANQ